ncbi:hypothetical protein Pcinc_020143 [Petrolisthes cinctipes]|uniref:RRM domain-containing protein n=1 Tax=Petrolisthes cinctipes TaxID=88211 RepID=A0AAE1FJN2_PETCI|nr:hypothetical protein Pcinc_020143 [Petrolisthes cinctipes]
MKVKKPKILKDAIISNEIQAESVIPINKKKKKEMKDTICDETQTESVIPIKKKKEKMNDAMINNTETESIIPVEKKKMKDTICDETQTESIIPVEKKKKKKKDAINDKTQTESIIPINKKKKKKKMKDATNDKSQTESFIPIKKKKMKDATNDKTQTESIIPINNKKKKKKMKSVNGQSNGEGNTDARTTMADVDGSREDEANMFSAEEKSQGKVWNETEHINGGNGVSEENWNETGHIDEGIGFSAEDKEQEKVWDDIERFEQENELGEEDKEQDKVWNDIEHFEQQNEVRTEENAEPERQELTRAEMLEMEKRTVFVGNVNITTKRKQLLKFFSKYGKVETLRLRSAAVAKHGMTKKESVIMKKFHKQRSSLNAYIRFTQKEMVEEALKANGIEFMEKHLRVDRSIQSETGGKENKKHAVFIGNLPFGAEEEDLWRYFADCGEIDNVRVIRDSESGSCKGFCFINFKSSGGVEIALLKHGEEFMGRELRVMRCHKKPKQKYGPTKRGVYGDRNKMQSGFKKRKPTTNNNNNNREFPQNKVEGKYSGTTSSKKMQSGFKKRKLTTTNNNNNNNNKEFPQSKVDSKYSTTTSKRNTKGGYTGMKMTENKKFKKVKKAKGKLRKEERKKKSIAHHLTGVKKNKKKTV